MSFNVSFNVSADAYGRFMGRFSEPLAVKFAAWAGVRPGMQGVDVGCGPGALTAQLVAQLGAEQVRAIDPSEPFVEAARLRFPGLDVVQAAAEDLPLPDDSVDIALAQLVVHFMKDPVAGLVEMARVTRPGGTVAASVWDLGPSGRAPVAMLWRAVHDLDPDFVGESELPGGGEGELAALAAAAGLSDIRSGELTVSAGFAGFDDWWEPYTRGVGPAGAYVAGLDDAARQRLRARCEQLLPAGRFEISATAWCVRGRS